MKTIIAGGRDITDVNLVKAAIKARPQPWFISEVVSGEARGVDTVAKNLALAEGMPLKSFPADWTKFGDMAGFFRNTEMACYADALIAIWDGKSPGTKHMLHVAHIKGLKIYCHYI